MKVKEFIFIFPLAFIDWVIPKLEELYDKMLKAEGCFEDDEDEK